MADIWLEKSSALIHIVREGQYKLSSDVSGHASASSHSLRRSGATHMLMNSVPIETIRVLGDWRSGVVFRYLKPSADSKLSVLQDKF